MSATAVSPQLACAHHLASGELVDERRLADARRAQERHGAGRRQVCPHVVEAFSGDVAHRQHGDADGHSLGFCDLLVVLADVELRQDDDGIRPESHAVTR